MKCVCVCVWLLSVKKRLNAFYFDELGFPEIQGVLMGKHSFGDNLKVQVNTEDPASTLKSLMLSYIRHEVSKSKLTFKLKFHTNLL